MNTLINIWTIDFAGAVDTDVQMCKCADVQMSESAFAMRSYKNNLIVRMTFQFSLDIIEFAEVLRNDRRYAFSDQVLRSGCSVGANVKEAQGAESKSDFIHKMKVAYKEAEEVEYWLQLCEFAPMYPNPGNLLEQVSSIMKVLGKIIASSKR